jgi:hypothetical protein
VIGELRPAEVWVTHGREEALVRWCTLAGHPRPPPPPRRLRGRALLLAFRDRGAPTILLGPPRLQEAMRDLTALGGFVVLVVITLGVAGLI